MNRFCSLAALAFGTAIVPMAQADTTYDARSEIVRYADLDTDSASGSAVLVKRLNDAAHRVCGELQPRSLSMVAKYQACVHLALGNALAAAADRKVIKGLAQVRPL